MSQTMKVVAGLILAGLVVAVGYGLRQNHQHTQELLRATAADTAAADASEAAAEAERYRASGRGNELSLSPNQPASPDQWWLRSLSDGKDIRFSQFKGKVVFLNFWATWCGPCLTEMPTLERMYQKLQGKDIVVLIVANQNPRDIQSYVSQNNFSFPIYTCGVPPELFMWHSLPTTFVIDPDGKVVKTFYDPYAFDGDEFVNSLIQLKT